MGIQIGFNPSQNYAGMGDWAGPGGGAPPGMALGGPGYGYNPAIVAAHQAANTPAVNTGNNFSPGSFNPFNKNPYNIDNIKQPALGFVSKLTGPEFFSFQPGQFNPFNANPYNIDNIVTPSGLPSNPWLNFWNNQPIQTYGPGN